jgi:gliding motility-associated-like protein
MRKNTTLSTLFKFSLLLILFAASEWSYGQACNPFWDKSVSANCVNSPITFRANSPSRTAWFWDFGDGFTNSVDVDPVHPYTTPGKKTITYSFTAPGGGKCTGSFDIFIKESPKIYVRPLYNKNQCFAGNRFCFIDSTRAATGSKIKTVKYLFSDGGLYTITNPTKDTNYVCHSVIDPAGGFFDLTIEAEDTNGCITKIKYDTFIRVYPKIGVNFISSAPNACLQSTATITNLTPSFTPLSAIKTFVWNFGFPGSLNNIITGSGSQNINTQYWKGPTGNGKITHLYNVQGMPSGTYVFNGKLVVTTIQGCVDSFTFKGSATISILNIKIIADPDSSCASTPLVEFTAVDRNTLQPIKANQFLWNFGDPPSGPANFNNTTLIKAPHNYGIGPWMTSLNVRSGPCNVTVFDTIFKLGVSSTIEIPFNRVPEDEKYQCVIKDTVHFVNNSSFYHADDIPVNEDSSGVYWYYTTGKTNKIGYWEKPTTLDTIFSYTTYQGKPKVTTIFYLENDTLESIDQPLSYADSIIFYVKGQKVRRKITGPIISGKDTLFARKQKEYAFRWPGNQTALPSTFPPATQRHKEHALRLWTFGDNYAPKCTTDTKRNKNVGLNCNFSRDSLPVHWYTPWEEIYKFYRNGQFYGAAAEKTVLCKGGQYCYKVRYFPQMTTVIPADTLVIVPKDSTFIFYNRRLTDPKNDTIFPCTPEKMTGTFRIKKIPTKIIGLGTYVPTLGNERWKFRFDTTRLSKGSVTVKNIQTGTYSTRSKGTYTMTTMRDQFELKPQQIWRTYNYKGRRFADSTIKSKVPPYNDSFLYVKSKVYPFKDSTIKSKVKLHELVYHKYVHVHDEPLHNDRIVQYKSGKIPYKGTYTGDTSEYYANDDYLSQLAYVFADMDVDSVSDVRNIGKVTRIYLEKDTIESFYQKFDDNDSIIFYVAGVKVKKPLPNPIISGRDTLVIKESCFRADTAFGIPQVVITPGRTLNATPTTICLDTIIGGRDTFVQRSRYFIDSAFHRAEFYKNSAQCNQVSLYHEDTVHALRCKSTSQISLALLPPSGKGLKFEGIKCYAPPSPPYGLIFDVGETKPGCTQRLLKFNFDSAQGKNNWVTHGGFLAPPLPGSAPWHPGYQLAGAYPTRFAKPYGAGDIQEKNPGWVTVGVVIGNWGKITRPQYIKDCRGTRETKTPIKSQVAPFNDSVIVMAQCYDTTWYHNYFRYLYLDSRFTVIQPEKTKKTVCVGDTITFKLVDPIMDSITQLVWNWNDDEGSYYEERTFNYQPYKGPNANRNDRVVTDWKKTDKWLYNYVIRLEYDGFSYRTIDTIVTGIIRKWVIAADVSRAGVALENAFKALNLNMNEIPSTEIPLYFGNGTGKGCIDTTGLGSLISYGVSPFIDALTYHNVKVPLKTKIPPFKADSTIKSKKPPFGDSLIVYRKSKVAPFSDSLVSAYFKVGDTTWRYKDYTKKDSTIMAQKLHWRDGNQSGWETLKHRVKVKSKVCPYGDSTILSKVKPYGDSLRVNTVTGVAVNNGVYRHAYKKANRYFPTFQLRNTEGCFQPRNTEVDVGFFWKWTFSDSIICHGNTDIVLRDSIRYFAYLDPFNWLDAKAYWSDPKRFVAQRETKKIDWNEHDDTVIKSKKPPYCDSLAVNQFTTTGIGIPPFKWHYDEPGIYNIRIAMKDSLGCVDTAKQRVYVTGVKAGFQTLAPAAQACNNFYTFKDTSRVIDPCVAAKGKPCDNIVEWTWDWGDGKRRSKLQNPTHDYTDNGTFTIRLVVKTKLGCTDSAFFQIKINGPEPYFHPITDTIICADDSVTFINLSKMPLNPQDTLGWKSSWEWDFGDASTKSTLKPDTVGHRYKKPGTYSVYLTQFASIPGTNHRCPKTYPRKDTSLINRIERIIKVKPVADAEFKIEKNDTICPNTPVTFTSLSDRIYTRWSWIPGTGDTVSTTDSFLVYTKYSKPGTYKVTMIPDYNTSEFHKCLDTVKKTVVVLDVKAAFTVDEKEKPKFCFINGSTGATKYQWTFQNHPNPTSTEVNPCREWPDTGCYDVTLIAINDIGCADTTEDQVCSTFVSQFIPYNVFTPGGDDILNNTFRVKSEGIEKFDIVIYNRWGELVFESKDAKFAWNGKVKNTGAECPEGTYFYLINYKIYGKPLNDGKDKPISGSITLIRAK